MAESLDKHLSGLICRIDEFTSPITTGDFADSTLHLEDVLVVHQHTLFPSPQRESVNFKTPPQYLGGLRGRPLSWLTTVTVGNPALRPPSRPDK